MQYFFSESNSSVKDIISTNRLDSTWNENTKDEFPYIHRCHQCIKLTTIKLCLYWSNEKLGPNVNRNELSINEVREYTSRLGYAPRDFNKLNIIHVTGTKGKGSTCAFTESILKQYQPEYISKIGLYTSPHLKSVRERIRINGQPIDKELFAKYFWSMG